MIPGAEVQLVSRPVGPPTPDNFRLVSVEVAEPAEGEILVRNLFMSVDPYMRGRMNDVKSYVPPFQLDEALQGGAVGEVIASTVDSHKVGDVVLHGLGWRSHAVGRAKGFTVVDTTVAPASAYLGALGMPGLTAYAGLFAVARFGAGDRVFVSGAAGAVGSMVGQLVKLRGGTVIGSAGSAAKVAWLQDELGFDEAFNYHDGKVASLLAEAAPEGIDVYFDNVGGEHLEAAIGALGVHGRAVICGMISQYNATEPTPAPRNLAMIIGKRLRIEGVLVSDHSGLQAEFVREVAPALADGRVKMRETIVEGLEAAPEAFIGLLRGDNTGKMLVKLN